MATKNFKDYAIAGSNVTLTYDDINDTVTFAAQGNVQSVNGKTGVVVINKTDVSLGNVDNTSDISKPISTLVQNALNLKEGTITAGTTSQYYRGDKTFQTLDKTAVGLSNVDNTSDANKPISNATQTALNSKQATISLTTTGNSGASTFAANVLNIPNYTLAGLGGIGLTALSALTPLAYNNTTGQFSIQQATTSQSGYLSSTDWNTFNGKQDALSGTGFVKISGTTISYDNSSYYLSSNPSNYISLSALSSTATGLTYTNTTGVFSLTTGYAIPTTASATNWDSAYTNRITSLTTTGSSGASTLVSNVLNIPTYSLSGLGGQPLNANLTSVSALTYASTSFVKMTAAGTFALDTNTYLTAESDTLASVTGRGNTTTTTLIYSGTTEGIRPNTDSTGSIGASNFRFLSFYTRSISAVNNSLDIIGSNINLNDSSGNIKLKVFGSTGNVLIQNGGTFTDAGFRLDVNGSTRLNGALTLGMSPIVAASVVSTHKLQITIAGTTYYLLASNI